jgi:hypothetical protein
LRVDQRRLKLPAPAKRSFCAAFSKSGCLLSLADGVLPFSRSRVFLLGAGRPGFLKKEVLA